MPQIMTREEKKNLKKYKHIKALLVQWEVFNMPGGASKIMDEKKIEAGKFTEVSEKEFADKKMGGKDNWQHRSKGMLCGTCMFFKEKVTEVVQRSDHVIGRCRRHAPTMSGFPVVWSDDWCGSHKLDECKVAEKIILSEPCNNRAPDGIDYSFPDDEKKKKYLTFEIKVNPYSVCNPANVGTNMKDIANDIANTLRREGYGIEDVIFTEIITEVINATDND